MKFVLKWKEIKKNREKREDRSAIFICGTNTHCTKASWWEGCYWWLGENIFFPRWLLVRWILCCIACSSVCCATLCYVVHWLLISNVFPSLNSTFRVNTNWNIFRASKNHLYRKWKWKWNHSHKFLCCHQIWLRRTYSSEHFIIFDKTYIKLETMCLERRRPYSDDHDRAMGMLN